MLFSGMEFLVNFTQLFVGYVGIYLGGTDVFVPEHLLHAAQIGTAREEIGSKAVA